MAKMGKTGDSRSKSTTKGGMPKGTGSENANKAPPRTMSPSQRNAGKIKSYCKPGEGLKRGGY